MRAAESRLIMRTMTLLPLNPTCVTDLIGRGDDITQD